MPEKRQRLDQSQNLSPDKSRQNIVTLVDEEGFRDTILHKYFPDASEQDLLNIENKIKNKIDELKSTGEWDLYTRIPAHRGSLEESRRAANSILGLLQILEDTAHSILDPASGNPHT